VQAPPNNFWKEDALKILLTAFEPYDQWNSNSSWDALTELLKHRGLPDGITTRRYPVDLDKLTERLCTDLEKRFDAVLHLGQAPGTCAVHLESIAINVAGVTYTPGGLFGPILQDGPVGYRSQLPLGQMCSVLKGAGVPCSISYHAGTYLCNAILYLSQHWHAVRGLDCQVGFAHLPLTVEQTVASGREMPGLSTAQLARAIELMLSVVTEHVRSNTRSVLA
jgi:pyroglutamyl-peptidase